MKILLICYHVGDVERNDITGVRIYSYIKYHCSFKKDTMKSKTGIEIPEGLKEKCKPMDNIEDGTWSVFRVR